MESRGYRFTPLFAQVGAIPMGATTYEWVLGHERLLERPFAYLTSAVGRP